MMQRIQNANDKDQGFTLIELIVVVVIIGILAAIAIPLFLNQRQSAEDKKMISDVRNAVTHLETEYTTSNAYPDDAGFTAIVAAGEIVSSDGVTFGYANNGDTYEICSKNSNSSHIESASYNSATGDLVAGGMTAVECGAL